MNGFADRPQHPDFWRLSSVVLKHDGRTEEGSEDVGSVIGMYLDPESLVYMAQQRAAIFCQKAGAPSALVVALASAIIDGVLIGIAFERDGGHSDMARIQRVGRPVDPALGDWVSADGLAAPVYLSDAEVDGGTYWYGCGDEHPYTEEAEHCGTVGCHAHAGDDREGSSPDDQINWEVVRALINAEHSNQEAMLREANTKQRDWPPPATLGTALDSWRQMPPEIQQELAGAEQPQTVQDYLEILVERHGEDYPLP